MYNVDSVVAPEKMSNTHTRVEEHIYLLMADVAGVEGFFICRLSSYMPVLPTYLYRRAAARQLMKLQKELQTVVPFVTAASVVKESLKPAHQLQLCTIGVLLDSSNLSASVETLKIFR